MVPHPWFPEIICCLAQLPPIPEALLIRTLRHQQAPLWYRVCLPFFFLFTITTFPLKLVFFSDSKLETLVGLLNDGNKGRQNQALGGEGPQSKPSPGSSVKPSLIMLSQAHLLFLTS